MTGDVDQLLADWQALAAKLRERFDKPPPGVAPQSPLAGVTLSMSNVPVAADAIETIAPLYERWEGWLRRESRVGFRRDVDPGPEHPFPGPEDGAPLDGEWVSPDRASSKRLVHYGAGWRLITLTEGEGPDSQPALLEKVSLVAAGPAKTMLRYAIYWAFTLDPQKRPSLNRLASRFLGFSEH
jgi:hypothetical protein